MWFYIVILQERDTEPLTSNKIISLGDLHAMQKLRAAESSYLAGR